MMPDTNACLNPFSLPMNDLADAQTLVRAIEALLASEASACALLRPCPIPAVVGAETVVSGKDTTPR
jgi:hypothetical protein